MPAADSEAAVNRALDLLGNCRLCELNCGVDRRAGRPGHCRLGEDTHVFRLYVSYAEELELSPALMVYLGGCNFRCEFCTQAPRCFVPAKGPSLLAPETIERIDSLSKQVRWINLIGGEPSLHPHALIELRRRVRTAARWLLNTNGFFTPACFELLDPLVDLHLVDFKFGNDLCAMKLAGVPHYVEILRRNMASIYRQNPERLLVRHLLMPGHERCCFEPVAAWISSELPAARFRLMTGYVPNYRSLHDPEMSRTVPLERIKKAAEICERLTLRNIE